MKVGRFKNFLVVVAWALPLLSPFLSIQPALAAQTAPGGSSSDQYVLVFESDQQSTLEGCLTQLSCSDYSTIKAFAQGGVWGSTPVEMNFESHEGSGTPYAPQFVANYSCDGYQVSALLVLNNFTNLSQSSYKSYVYLINIRNPTTGKDYSEANSSGDGYLTATDIKSSGLPGRCQPAQVETGSNNVPITVPNYASLGSSQQANWGSAAASVATTSSGGGGGGGGGGGSTSDECDTDSVSLGWLLCPAINLATSTVHEIVQQVIIPELQVRPLTTSSTEYGIWSNIRNLANVIFVLAFLAIIFANVLNFNVETYAIKKMLPRLVAAVVLVQFSFILSAAIVDIGNILGNGIQGLVNTTVINHVAGSSGSTSGDGVLTTLGAAMDFGFAVGIVAVIGVPTLFIAVVGALISAVGVLFTLIARRLIITMLVIMSPLALALWVLPNTEKVFKLWINNFIKVVMMFPMIMFILSVAAIGAVAEQNAGGTSKIEGLLGALFPIIAFFMIPMTFKWAGGAMGLASGYIGGAAKGARGRTTDAMKNSRWKQALDENRAERKQTKLEHALESDGLKGWWAGARTRGDVLGNNRRLTRRGIRHSDELERRQLEQQKEAREHALATNMAVRRRTAQEEEYGAIEKALAGASKSEVLRSFNAALQSGDRNQIIGTGRMLHKMGALEQPHVAQIMDALSQHGAEAQFDGFETIMQGDFAGMKQDHPGLWSAWAQMAGAVEQGEAAGLTRGQAVEQAVARGQAGSELLSLSHNGRNGVPIDHLGMSGDVARSLSERSAEQMVNISSDGLNGLEQTTLHQDVVNRDGDTIARAGEGIDSIYSNDQLWDVVSKPAVAQKINDQSRRLYGLGIFEQAQREMAQNRNLTREQALLNAAQARVQEITAAAGTSGVTAAQQRELEQIRSRVPGAI